MKYKKGDQVTVRSWDDMVDEFGVDAAGDIKCRLAFVTYMKKYCGKTFTIKKVKSNHYRLIGCKKWEFTDEMVEPTGTPEERLYTKEDMLEAYRYDPHLTPSRGATKIHFEKFLELIKYRRNDTD